MKPISGTSFKVGRCLQCSFLELPGERPTSLLCPSEQARLNTLKVLMEVIER